jgi:hypothetical protein
MPFKEDNSLCHCGCGQLARLVKNPINRFEQFCKEIEAGPFSILSAKDEIKQYIRLSMEDGHRRGFHSGYQKAATEAAEDAAGESI